MKDLRCLGSNRNKFHEIRKKQEQRVMQKIKTAPKNLDLQDTEKEHANQDEEVKAVLADIRRRSKKGTI